MSDSKLFASDPRDFALELVSEGYATADHLLLCCLKYMSHDDVREMLDSDEDDEPKNWLEQFDDHDLEAMLSDIANGNLEIGDDEAADRYRHENIIRESITNGQLTQAKEQCTRYGYDYDEMRRIHG